MSDRPAISVVIPTFGRPRLLSRAIASVLAQTFGDFELIVADDASPEGTREAVAAFDDPRIVYLRSPRNLGSSAARNLGVRRARAPIVALLDDDDEYLPGFLQATHEALASPPDAVGFSWCGARIVRDLPDGSERLVRERRWERFQDGAGRLDPPHVLATGYGLAVRADCFASIGGFDEGLRACVDVDFLLRLGARFDFRLIPEVLVKCHQHAGDRLTDRTPERAEAYRRILEAHAERLESLPVLRVSIERKLAAICYHLGRRAEGRRTLIRALRGPGRPGTIKFLAALEILGPPGHGRGREIVGRLLRREP